MDRIPTSINSALILIVCLFVMTVPVLAEEEGGDEPELPKSGLLASAGKAGHSAASVDIPWGGVDTTGAKSSPLSGSISQGAGGDWVVSVFNNSSDKYRASFSIRQYNGSGKTVKSNGFSASLKPGAKEVREVRGRSGITGAKLFLSGWKKSSAPSTKKSDEDGESANKEKQKNGIELSDEERELILQLRDSPIDLKNNNSKKRRRSPPE